MNSKQNAHSKLFILYLIDQFSGQTESDLVSLALNSLYLDYFSYNENFSKLLEQNLIYVGLKKGDLRKDVQGRTEERVYLTEQGQAVLAELLQDLPLPMRATIDQLSQDCKERLELKDEVIVDYKEEHDGYYRIEFRIMSGANQRMALSLLLPDENACKKMAKNWKANSFAIYNDILKRFDS